MPTDLAVVTARKHEALMCERHNAMILLGCCIACLVVLVCLFTNASFASAVELMIIE